MLRFGRCKDLRTAGGKHLARLRAAGLALELGYKASRDKGLSEANLLTAAMAAFWGSQPCLAKALDLAQLCAALHTNRLLRSRRSVSGPLSVSLAGRLPFVNCKCLEALVRATAPRA